MRIRNTGLETDHFQILGQIDTEDHLDIYLDTYIRIWNKIYLPGEDAEVDKNINRRASLPAEDLSGTLRGLEKTEET